MKKLICNEVARCQPASLQRKLFHIPLHIFYFHFLRMYHDCFFRRGFESVWVQFLSAESGITCNLPVQHDSSKSTIFMLNMAFDVLLSEVFVKYRKLESFVYCNRLFGLCFGVYVFYWKLIILHHGNKNFLFWHLYQTDTFNNNLNEEGMITSHLMCANFFMINLNVIITFMLQLFNSNRETFLFNRGSCLQMFF